MKMGNCARVLLLAALLTAYGASSAAGAAGRDEPVKMKITVTNPHAEEEREISINKPLPPEITDRGDILSSRGLEIVYDAKSSLFYARTKEPIKLKPKEIRRYTIELRDVWYISPEKLADMRDRAERALNSVGPDSPKRGDAERIDKSINDQLAWIAEFQNNPALPKQEYILGYQGNMLKLKEITGDIETIESYTKISGRPDVMEDPNAPVDAPTRTATWLVIFVILTFLGIMAGIFFYVWQRSARGMESPLAEARRNAFPGSDQNGGA